MSKIFISHSSGNNAEAKALSQWLISEGWDDQFLDLDPARGITAGEKWEKSLHQAAGRCDAVLFMVSADWLASNWCRREFTIAQGLGKRLFVLLIGGTKRSDVEAQIKEIWQLVDLSGGTDHGAAIEVTLDADIKPRFVYFSRSALTRLREGLKKAGLDPQSFPWPPADDPERAPYRGMRPLEFADAGIFFGREAPTIEMLAQLRGLHAAAPPRFMAILGASGAGKSSFLRAGILPRLKRDDRYYLPLPVIRPERAALTGTSGLLESLWTIRQQFGLGWTRKQLTGAIETGASALLPLLRQLAEHGQVLDSEGQAVAPPTLVLAIDQAEELFQSEGREEAARFLSLLHELLQAESPRILALCTIRSDSYEHLQSAPELIAMPQRTFSLPPLPKGAYRQVIEGPAALLKHSARPLRIEPKLTEALLRDVEEGGAKDALPLLAFTLERLYADYSADGELSLQEYEDLGRIAGAIETAVDQALKAAQTNPKLPQDRDACLKLLRRGLIPWMAGIDPRTNLPYRKVARLAQVPEEARALIEHFVNHRLLAKDTDVDGEKTVEPAHEALLRQWTKLRGWLEEDAAALSTLESVKAASRDWVAKSKTQTWLIHAGGRLEDAEALHQRSDLAANFDSDDRAYLAECRKAEAERRDSELRQARELAEAQEQRVEQQKRVVHRTRQGLAVASVLLVLAVVAALFAWRAERQSVNETARADLTLRQAAQRALGRAREQLETDDSTYLAYLAESVGYTSAIAREEAALAAQQRASPVLIWAIRGRAVPEGIFRRVAAFSPDGRRMVTASFDDSARLLDAATGATLGMPMPHDGAVSSATFSPDGLRVVTASWDKTARLWIAASGAALGETMHHEGLVLSATFSPDGLRVVTTSSGYTASLWDAETGAALVTPIGHLDGITSAVFSPDSKRLVTTSFDHTAQLWDVATGATLGEPMPHANWVLSAAFSPEGARIVTASADRTAQLWDAASGATLGTPMPHEDEVTSAAFSPDGLRVVTASMDGTARQWDASSGVAVSTSMLHKGPVTSVTFSPDGLLVLTASGRHFEPSSAQLWVAETGKSLGTVMRHDRAIRLPAFSHDGRRVLTGGYDDSVRLWEAWSGKAVSTPLRHASPVGSAAFSPDGLRLVTGSKDGTAQLWDAVSGAGLKLLKGHEQAVRSVAFRGDGGQVVTASWDNTARLWDPATGAAVGIPMRHAQAVNSAAFSPDGRHVVTASADHTAQLWNAATGAALGKPMRHEEMVYSAAFSPDGQRIVTASLDRTVRLWNAATGTALGTPMRHEDAVYLATFSPDGHRVLTAGKVRIGGRGAAWIWDPATWVTLGMPMRHEEAVKSAFFSPDGLRVVTASHDRTARLWDAASGAALGASVDANDLLTLSGRRVADNGQLEWIPGIEWMDIINEAKTQAKAGTTPKDQIMRWHFADRSTRTISPFSKITVPQHIEREIDWVLEHPQTKEPGGPNYSPKILADAYRLDPGHPLILLALSVFEDRPETKALWNRLSFPRFEKDARLAARAAEILLIEKDFANARKAAEIALALPNATDADRAKAQAVLDQIDVAADPEGATSP